MRRRLVVSVLLDEHDLVKERVKARLADRLHLERRREFVIGRRRHRDRPAPVVARPAREAQAQQVAHA
ncbi:hypothetical protein OV079_30625 [Nannocystis pusilla]|uniref:Uncharacterized protein n=1 Tax=Nannocystis pusilla TaxID=889268 RepID=A0A9X3J0P0_9BACT|nr:hypothetical protein [Nannocystis pusilla]MCY1009839.1 hypothetical protein [Nannocystis pusilla]